MKAFGDILVTFWWQVIEHSGNKSQPLNLEVNFLSQHRKRVFIGWATENNPQIYTSEFTQVIFLFSLVIQSITHTLGKHNFYLIHLSSLQGEAIDITKSEINCWLSSGFVKKGRNVFTISYRIIQKASSGANTNSFIRIILLTIPVFSQKQLTSSSEQLKNSRHVLCFH